MTSPKSVEKPVAVEPRWPGLIAVMAAAILNWLLPEALSAGPGWAAVAAIAVLAFGALMLPHFHTYFGYAAATIVTVILGRALAVLVLDLVTHKGAPGELLQGAVLIWSMNVFVFASWYWRLDAGGPHSRARMQKYEGGAFLFPQTSLPAEARAAARAEGWRPYFIDYLFLAFNTSTALSPTDVPVLSRWAKVLMMIQSLIALTTLAVVAARAVNIL